MGQTEKNQDKLQAWGAESAESNLHLNVGTFGHGEEKVVKGTLLQKRKSKSKGHAKLVLKKETTDPK